MADKNFKVRQGLDVDGDATLTGDLAVQGNDIKSSTGSTAITLSDNNVEVKGGLQVTGNTISSSTATAMTFVGNEVRTGGDLQVTGNTIRSSTNAAAIELSGANVEISGDLTVSGNDIKSSTGATAITMSGADLNVAGDLTVTGNDIKSSTATAMTMSGANVEVKGDLQVTGNDIKGSSTLTALTLSGEDVEVVGDLKVTGNTIIMSSGFDTIRFSGTSDVEVVGDLRVTGNDIKSSANTTAITLSNTDVAVAGDLTVTGNDIKSSSATAITMSGSNVEVKGDLQVTGNDIRNDLGNSVIQFVNTTDADINGNLFVDLDLQVGGNNINMAGGQSALTFSGTGDVEVTGDLKVSGNDIKSSTGATAITLSGDSVTIPGDFTVNGTTTTLNTQTLNVEDNIITVNYGQTSPVLNAGIEVARGVGNFVPAIRWDESTDRWQISNDGSAYIDIPNQDLDTNTEPTFAGATLGEVTVGVATNGTITTTTGNLILDSFSDIITVNADTQLGTNKSIQMGTGVYSSSTDIWRNPAGTSGIFDGIEISNGGATSTTSALVLRQFGQSTSGGVAATAGVPQIFSVASRGTQASPLAVNAGQNIFGTGAFTNLGDTTGGGTGAGYSNDVLSTPAGGYVLRASENHRQSLQATFTANTSGTTLTVTAMTSGTIVPGQQIRPTTSLVNNTIVVLRQLTSTEAGNALGGAGTYALTSTALGTRTGQTFNTFNVNTGSAIVNAITPPGTALTGSVNAFTFGWDASSYGTGILSTDVLGINTPYSSFPQRTRTVTAITGGNTLTVTGHGLTTTGAIFVIAQAGNPNGLTTNLAYYVDTIVDANNITLRTNSVSGGAVTGLTDGTGLFLQCEFYAQNRTGANNVGSSVDLYGYRGGNVFTGPSYAANKTNDYLGQLRFNGSTGAAFPVGNVRVIGQATQDWGVGAYGSQLLIQTTKNSTTTPADTAKIGLNTTTFLSDSFLFENSSGTDNLTIDSSGNVVITGDLRVNGNDLLASDGNTNISMTSNTLTEVKGDLQVTGNDIKASDGNTNISMTSNTLTEVKGDLQVTGNDIKASDGSTAITLSGTNITVGYKATATKFVSLQDNDATPEAPYSYEARTAYAPVGDSSIYTQLGLFRSRGTHSSPSAALKFDEVGKIEAQVYTGTNWSGTGGNTQQPGYSYAGVFRTDTLTDVSTDSPAPFAQYGYSVVQNRWVFGGSNAPDSDSSASGWNNYTWEMFGDKLTVKAYNQDTFFAQVATTPKIIATTSGGTEVPFKFYSTGYFKPDTGIQTDNFKNASGTTAATFSGTDFQVVGDIKVGGGDIQNPGGTSAITLTSGNTATTIRGDTIDLKVAAGTAATSANIGYTRTYGEFAYTNAAGFAIAAQDTIYAMPLDTTLNASGTSISNTSRININVSGWYKIIMSLQITLTVSNQPGQIDFWLRKNGVDVTNSKTQVDLLKDQKAVIAMDWLVESDGNDYWEIVYVGTTANYADIDFPTIAATTTPYVSPLAPALIVNVIPAGA